LISSTTASVFSSVSIDRLERALERARLAEAIPPAASSAFN
jgi:hypothetical protein